MAAFALGLQSITSGLATGVAFNPAFSLVGAAVAAGLYGFPKASRRNLAWAVAALLAAWLLGDGFRVMGRLQDTLAGSAGMPAWAAYTLLAGWALAGLAFGYAAPAALGAYVGRQVVRGTGWLSAGFVACLTSAGLASLAVPASVALEHAARVLGHV